MQIVLNLDVLIRHISSNLKCLISCFSPITGLFTLFLTIFLSINESVSFKSPPIFNIPRQVFF